MNTFFKILFYFIGFVVVGMVTALLTFKVIDSGQGVSVPSLIGKNVQEATELLSGAGLFLDVQGEAYDDNQPAGAITQQDIPENQKVKKGSGISVFVSKGRAEFTIPFLEGMGMSDVELTLMSSGLELGRVIRVHSDAVEKDVVIAQRPLSGISSEKKVNLLVSLGPYEITYQCPSFVKMTIEEARRIAGALGLRLIEQETGTMVVSQNPAAGSLIKKGGVVEITLGRKRGFWF